MKIGFIGAGKIGRNLSHLFVDHDYDVILSNSRDPQTLTGLVQDLGPHASATWAKEAASLGDVVVIAIPFRNYQEVPVDPLKGKVVIDTMNYMPMRDGDFPDLDSGKFISSELLQQHLPTSRVVKAFNTVFARELTYVTREWGQQGRLTLPLAGDDTDAKKTVAQLMDEIGFTPYDVGPLHDGYKFQRGTPAFHIEPNKVQLMVALQAATKAPRTHRW